MIDRTMRAHLADAIHALASGAITNDEFEDRLLAGGIVLLAGPARYPDPAIGPIAESAWCLYADARTCRLGDSDRLPPEAGEAVRRWVLFLRSGLAYEWPPFRLINPALGSLSGWVLSVLTLGALPRRRPPREFDEWQQAGEYAVWPFFRRADYDAACHPRPHGPRRPQGQAAPAMTLAPAQV